MALKRYLSNNGRHRRRLGIGLAFLLALGACVSGPPATKPGKAVPASEKTEPPEALGSAPDSRARASLALIRQGSQLLAEKKFDGAIQVLERAIGINPADGPGYYYLAEAWIGKAEFSQAAQFNSLAALYLRADKKWSERVRSQKERIDGAGKSSGHP